MGAETETVAMEKEVIETLQRLLRLAGKNPANYQFKPWIPGRPLKYVNQGDDTFYAISGTYQSMLAPNLPKAFAYMREKRIAPLRLEDVSRLVGEHRGQHCNTLQATDSRYTLTAGYMGAKAVK